MKKTFLDIAIVVTAVLFGWLLASHVDLSLHVTSENPDLAPLSQVVEPLSGAGYDYTTPDGDLAAIVADHDALCDVCVTDYYQFEARMSHGEQAVVVYPAGGSVRYTEMITNPKLSTYEYDGYDFYSNGAVISPASAVFEAFGRGAYAVFDLAPQK